MDNKEKVLFGGVLGNVRVGVFLCLPLFRSVCGVESEEWVGREGNRVVGGIAPSRSGERGCKVPSAWKQGKWMGC